MTAYDVGPGEHVHPGKPVIVDRYTGAARINHWITAISFVLLLLSGAALFHPDLFFLSGLFGGGQTTRAIHPWIGVVLSFGFGGLFFRFWKANLWKGEDGTWMARLRDVLAGHEEKVPESGKYNAGQKVLFWSMAILVPILFATGLVTWQEYFGHYTTISTQQTAVFVHAVAAITIVCVWIVHIYAAIWVRGTLRGMIKGSVTGGWAWRFHRKWLRELVSEKR